MDFTEYLRDQVLELGVVSMILDDVNDMEEIRLKDIHIRHTHECNYKIYKPNTNIEIFFNTMIDYRTQDIKEYDNCLNSFFKAFITAMRNSNRIDNDFVKEIILQLIQYSFMRNKNTMIDYINQDNIEQYVQLGITDTIEDIIFRSQDEEEIRNMYPNYEFNYEAYLVVEEDDEGLIIVPDNIDIEAGDNMIDEVSLEELNRFKNHLENKGELIVIELCAISFFMNHLIYPYTFDYNNFIRYIMGEEMEETDDEEEDVEMD